MRLLHLLPATARAERRLLVRIVSLQRVGAQAAGLRVVRGYLVLLMRLHILHRISLRHAHLRLLSRLDIKQHIMIQLVVLPKINIVVRLDILSQRLRVITL